MFIPVLIVIFGSLDMYKAVIGGDAEAMKKAGKQLGYRMVLGIFIFFLPTLVYTILGYLLPDDYETCAKCLFEPGTCKNGIVIPSANDDPNNSDDPVKTESPWVTASKPTSSQATSAVSVRPQTA